MVVSSKFKLTNNDPRLLNHCEAFIFWKPSQELITNFVLFGTHVHGDTDVPFNLHFGCPPRRPVLPSGYTLPNSRRSGLDKEGETVVVDARQDCPKIWRAARERECVVVM